MEVEELVSEGDEVKVTRPMRGVPGAASSWPAGTPAGTSPVRSLDDYQRFG